MISVTMYLICQILQPSYPASDRNQGYSLFIGRLVKLGRWPTSAKSDQCFHLKTKWVDRYSQSSGWIFRYTSILNRLSITISWNELLILCLWTSLMEAVKPFRNHLIWLFINSIAAKSVGFHSILYKGVNSNFLLIQIWIILPQTL